MKIKKKRDILIINFN